MTDELTHVMSVIRGELLDFVSLVRGKYQITRETCCWVQSVQSHAGDVLLLFPVPLPGDHLNSCYSWPDIDFRVILRLDLDESQRGNSIPHMADVGFHFVHMIIVIVGW